MSERIERVIIDLYNNQDVDILAESQYRTGDALLTNAESYVGCVEFASIDLTNIVLDYSPDYEIVILNDEGGKDGNRFPELPYYANYFKFQGPLREVEELNTWWYDIFHKKTLPYSLGNLYATKDGYFKKNITQEDYDNCYANGLFQVYFNSSMKRLLPEFVTDTSMTIEGKTYYKFADDIGETQQSRDTLAQLLKAVSIRFYTSLPVQSYRVYNQALGVIGRETILTTIAINNQNTDIINKTSKRYEPSVFRHFSLGDVGDIKDFIVYAKIYYSNGYSTMHTLSPGDYMHLQLSFLPKNQVDETNSK